MSTFAVPTPCSVWDRACVRDKEEIILATLSGLVTLRCVACEGNFACVLSAFRGV